jgi:hypothetical protein
MVLYSAIKFLSTFRISRIQFARLLVEPLVKTY